MHTPTPPLGPQVSGYKSQSQAWNSPRVRKRGSRNGCRYFDCKEKTQKKSNDTGTEKKTEKHQEMERKAKEKSLDTNGLCVYGLKIEDTSQCFYTNLT